MVTAWKTKSNRTLAYLQHTTQSIHQWTVLRAGEEIGAGQLYRAHHGPRGGRTRGCQRRVTWSNNHMRRVCSHKVGTITQQQRQAPGTEIGEAAGQVSGLHKLLRILKVKEMHSLLHVFIFCNNLRLNMHKLEWITSNI